MGHRLERKQIAAKARTCSCSGFKRYDNYQQGIHNLGDYAQLHMKTLVFSQ